jgi:hypothetical protein
MRDQMRKTGNEVAVPSCGGHYYNRTIDLRNAQMSEISERTCSFLSKMQKGNRTYPESARIIRSASPSTLE